MRLLHLIYLREKPVADPERPGISKKRFLALFEDIDLNDDDFHKDEFVPGTGGETALFKYMARALKLLD